MTLRAAAEQFTTIEAVRDSNNCGCVTANDPTDEVLSNLIDMASDELCRLSYGRVYGRQTIVDRPDRCGCWDTCGCCGLDRVPLYEPDPVILSVKINGDTLASDAYAIHEDRQGYGLVRVSNTAVRPPSWPSWQNLWMPDSADDTFSVTYTYGVHVDYVIERAARELVCYYAQQDEKRKNQLPKGTVSSSYNNSTVSLEERRLGLRGGAAGDSASIGESMSEFLAIWGGPRSTVYSPELDLGWSHHVIRPSA